jgi:ATP-binding cassette subfamily B protein
MIKLISRLWTHLTSRRQTQFVFFLILTIVGSFTEVISLGAIIPFIASLSNPEDLLNYYIISDILIHFDLTSIDQIRLATASLFAGAALFAGSIRLLILFISAKISFMTAHDLGVKIYKFTLHKPYELHLERNSSEIIAGVTSKVSTVSGVLQATITFVNSLFLILFISIALTILNPMIAIISAVSFGSMYSIVTFFVRKRLYENSSNIANESTRAIKSLQEGLNNIRDIILDGSQKFYRSIYNASDLKLKTAQANNLFISGSPKYLVESFGMVIISGIAFSLSNSEGGILESLPLLGALVLGAQRLLPALQQGFSMWAHMVGQKASVADVLELLDQSNLSNVKNHNAELKIFNNSIELRGVSFGYASSTHDTLIDININIKKGLKVAFIGETGSGKSTLIDVIMGLLKPSKGSIVIDGLVLKDTDYEGWQKHVAHVPQKIFLSDATISDNITLGEKHDEVDRNLLEESIKNSQLSSFLANSPDGYNTRVGEFGCALSGGQIQRIGIARALYKRPDVLILDEATSALDTNTEFKVMNAISQLNKNMTIIIITHRLTTVKDCDVIYEVDSGRIINKGTYDELLQSSINLQHMKPNHVGY